MKKNILVLSFILLTITKLFPASPHNEKLDGILRLLNNDDSTNTNQLLRDLEINHDPNQSDTLFTIAVKCGYPNAAKKIQDKLNCDLLDVIRSNRNDNQLQKVMQLLAQGADSNYSGNCNESVLTWAAENGHTEIAEKLVELGADIKHTNHWGRTAFLTAAFRGHTQTVQKLLELGADIEEHTNDMFGFTALIWAIIRNHAQTVQKLVELGADVNHANKNGDTPLMFAVGASSDLIMVEILLQHKAVVHHTNNEGRSALEQGQCKSNPKVATLLVDAMDDRHNIVECSKIALSSHSNLQEPYKKPVVQKLQSILFDRSIAFLAFQHLADQHYQPSDASSSSSSSAKGELIRHPGELLLIPKLMLTSNVLRQLPNGITPSALMPVLEEKNSLYKCLTPLILGEQPKPSLMSCPSKSEVYDSEDDACNGSAAAGK